MRLTQFCKRARGYLPENKVKYKEMLPMKLKNSVSNKGERDDVNPCVQEIMNLLSCLKKNDYNQTSCTNELDTLSQCHSVHRETKKKEQDLSKRGFLNPGAKQLNPHQIRILLKRFPQL